VEIQKEPRWG